MILENATFEAYDYYLKDLPPQSCKPIVACCSLCGKFKVTSKNAYRTFCQSCIQKGKKASKETKALMSTAKEGNTNCLGYKQTEEHKAKQKGKNNHNFKGGKKVVWARKRARRKQQLGYTLLMPIKEGEVGHHVTNEFVIGIPTEVHNKVGGSRKKHRTKVLKWLKVNDKKKYKLVLCILAKEPLV